MLVHPATTWYICIRISNLVRFANDRKGATPWTIFLSSVDPIPGQKDTFRLFWGAGDGNTGTGIVKVSIPSNDGVDEVVHSPPLWRGAVSNSSVVALEPLDIRSFVPSLKTDDGGDLQVRILH